MKKFKAVVSVLLVAVMLISLSLGVSAEEKEITVMLDGEILEFDVAPTLENGRTLVPMRVIFEALGAKVEWDAETWTAIATKDDVRIEITIDSTTMMKNGEAVMLDVPARLKAERTLVPVRAVSEGLGAEVDWNDELWQVIITTSPKTTEYHFSQLSPKDMETLKADAAELRYYYEQVFLPDGFLSDAEYASELIKDKVAELTDIPYILWGNMMFSYIISLQIESEDNYNVVDVEAASDEEFSLAYQGIAEKAGLDPFEAFDVNYEETPLGKDILLITFKSADEPLNCLYIAIAAEEKSVRVFTAEKTGLSDDSGYMFCEIKDETRGSFRPVQGKENFLKMIDSVIDLKEETEVWQARSGL